MESLQELLVEELRDIYSAEKQIVKALPKMLKGAQSKELKAALSQHLEVTKEQVTRLEAAFVAAGAKAKAKPCKAMEGLLEEGSSFLEEEANEFRDLQLIAAAQRVERYEISAYGTALSLASQCGLQECADLLAETLQEEETADETLTTVAESIYTELGGHTAEEDLAAEEEPEDGEAELATVGARSSGGSATARKAKRGKRSLS